MITELDSSEPYSNTAILAQFLLHIFQSKPKVNPKERKGIKDLYLFPFLALILVVSGKNNKNCIKIALCEQSLILNNVIH